MSIDLGSVFHHFLLSLFSPTPCSVPKCPYFSGRKNFNSKLRPPTTDLAADSDSFPVGRPIKNHQRDTRQQCHMVVIFDKALSWMTCTSISMVQAPVVGKTMTVVTMIFCPVHNFSCTSSVDPHRVAHPLRLRLFVRASRLPSTPHPSET